MQRSPEDPTEFLGIEWHRDAVEDISDIRYTNIVPDGPEEGGYIEYGRIDEEPYDAYYHIYNKGQDRLKEIEWNRETKEGRIKNPDYAGGEWRYWDCALKDTEES